MTTNDEKQFPGNWRIAADYDPNAHLMSLKGKDYLNVQNRLLWFIRDQRDFIVRGLATCSYVIRTELVEQDRDAGYAHFRTYVRDVMGNEATMYGSEQAKDFADYAEKASTKSLGRALLALGYGTAFAPEMDEGDRVVDTPVERRSANAPVRTPQPQQTAQTKHAPASTSAHPQDTPAASQARGTQATTVEHALDDFNQRANQHAQLDVCAQLRRNGHDSAAKVARILRAALPAERVINVSELAAGESDITLREVGLVLRAIGEAGAKGAAQ